MEDLLNYIKENITLVNKNNNIHIILGNNVCDNIFNSRLEKKNFKEILDKINTLYNTTANIEKYRLYKHKNSITMINNKTSTNYLYTITNPMNIVLTDNISLYCNIFNILQYNDAGISIFNYDSIEDMELYQINIDNLFNIEIQNKVNLENNEEYFRILFIIKKPNNNDKLYDKLESIVNLL